MTEVAVAFRPARSARREQSELHIRPPTNLDALPLRKPFFTMSSPMTDAESYSRSMSPLRIGSSAPAAAAAP